MSLLFSPAIIFLLAASDLHLFDSPPPRTDFYPAPGFRDAGSRVGGALYFVGLGGYGWLSTVTGGSGCFLGFGYDGVNPNSHASRANGRQLRCLQE